MFKTLTAKGLKEQSRHIKFELHAYLCSTIYSFSIILRENPINIVVILRDEDLKFDTSLFSSY